MCDVFNDQQAAIASRRLSRRFRSRGLRIIPLKRQVLATRQIGVAANTHLTLRCQHRLQQLPISLRFRVKWHTVASIDGFHGPIHFDLTKCGENLEQNPSALASPSKAYLKGLRTDASFKVKVSQRNGHSATECKLISLCSKHFMELKRHDFERESGLLPAISKLEDKWNNK